MLQSMAAMADLITVLGVVLGLASVMELKIASGVPDLEIYLLHPWCSREHNLTMGITLLSSMTSSCD